MLLGFLRMGSSGAVEDERGLERTKNGKCHSAVMKRAKDKAVGAVPGLFLEKVCAPTGETCACGLGILDAVGLVRQL